MRLTRSKTQACVLQQKIIPFQPVPSLYSLLGQMLLLQYLFLHSFISGKLPGDCKEALMFHKRTGKIFAGPACSYGHDKKVTLSKSITEDNLLTQRTSQTVFSFRNTINRFD